MTVLAPYHAPPVDVEPAAQDEGDRLAVKAVFLIKDTRGQRVSRVVVFDRNYGLINDRTGIQLLIHKVHCATGITNPVYPRLVLSIETPKRRQERRMNIQYALRESLDELRREEPHVPRQDHKIDSGLLQFSDE